MPTLTLDDGRTIELEADPGEIILDVVVIARLFNRDTGEDEGGITIGETAGTTGPMQRGLLLDALDISRGVRE